MIEIHIVAVYSVLSIAFISLQFLSYDSNSDILKSNLQEQLISSEFGDSCYRLASYPYSLSLLLRLVTIHLFSRSYSRRPIDPDWYPRLYASSHRVYAFPLTLEVDCLKAVNIYERPFIDIVSFQKQDLNLFQTSQNYFSLEGYSNKATKPP